MSFLFGSESIASQLMHYFQIQKESLADPIASLADASRSNHPSQTGKYVVRAEDLPRASKLPCTQRLIKRAEFEKYI